jgi:hypothetical protein
LWYVERAHTNFNEKLSQQASKGQSAAERVSFHQTLAAPLPRALIGCISTLANNKDP